MEDSLGLEVLVEGVFANLSFQAIVVCLSFSFERQGQIALWMGSLPGQQTGRGGQGARTGLISVRTLTTLSTYHQ